MKTLNTARTGNNATRSTDYHIVEQAGRFKVYDGAGRFRLTFATRDAAQTYIDGKHIDKHAAFQVAAAVLVILFLLCYPLTANAQTTVRCRRGTQPGFYHPYGRTVGVCYVYRPYGVLP